MQSAKPENLDPFSCLKKVDRCYFIHTFVHQFLHVYFGDEMNKKRKFVYLEQKKGTRSIEDPQMEKYGSIDLIDRATGRSIGR